MTAAMLDLPASEPDHGRHPLAAVPALVEPDVDDHAGQAGGPTFAPVSRAQLDDLPGVFPLLDETIDRRTLNVLAGPPGSYKSFLALSWACSIATGLPWEGRDPIGHASDDEPMHALYIAAEGAAGIGQRLRAWEVAHGVTADRLDVLTVPVNLLNDRELRRLVEIVGGCREDLDDNVRQPAYDLVVVDTLSRCTVGANENSAQDMSRVVAALDLVGRARTFPFIADYTHRPGDDDDGGTAVLVLHHTDKGGRGLRGSNVLEAAADTIYRVAPIGTTPRALLTRTKRKDGPRDDTRTLTVTAVPGTESIVLAGNGGRLPAAGAAVEQHAAPMSSAERVLSVLLAVEDAPSKAELREAAAMPSASFHRGLSTLVDGGMVREVDDDGVARYEVVST